jgi:hypothetical protein
MSALMILLTTEKEIIHNIDYHNEDVVSFIKLLKGYVQGNE